MVVFFLSFGLKEISEKSLLFHVRSGKVNNVGKTPAGQNILFKKH